MKKEKLFFVLFISCIVNAVLLWDINATPAVPTADVCDNKSDNYNFGYTYSSVSLVSPDNISIADSNLYLMTVGADDSRRVVAVYINKILPLKDTGKHVVANCYTTSYVWEFNNGNGSKTLEGLTQGEHTFFETVNSGCAACDTTIRLDLKILPPVMNVEYSDVICKDSSFEKNYHGITFSSTCGGNDCVKIYSADNDGNGDGYKTVVDKTVKYIGYLKSKIADCDSIIVTLNVTVPSDDYSDTVRFAAAICYGEDYTEDGFNITGATKDGVYHISKNDEETCNKDLPMKLTLTVLKDTGVIEATVCYGSDYTENGFNITGATKDSVYYISTDHKRTNYKGEYCSDSVTKLVLTVHPKDTGLVEATICYGSDYTENGFNITGATKDSICYISTDYKRINSNGSYCSDSVTKLVLTVRPINITDVYDTAYYGSQESEDYPDFNDLISDNIPTPSNDSTYIYLQTLEGSNGCDSITRLYLFVLKRTTVFGDNIIIAKESIRLHPNPISVGAVLTIELDGQISFDALTLHDINGRLLYTYSLVTGQRALHIPIKLRQGVYFLKMGNKAEKFVVVE